MTNNLRNYFPMIRTREEILNEIRETPQLYRTFRSWKGQDREEFLDFCSGVKGIKLLYDSFFKEIFSHEYDSERLDDLLSCLLEQKVTVVDVLPVDSTRIADESSLVIMDILVRLKDGSLVNVEIQKYGYMFPGERAACYSSDLVLRQYKRGKESRSIYFNERQKKSDKKMVVETTPLTESDISYKGALKEEIDDSPKQFDYKNMKTVYTIVLFEHSTEIFHQFPNTYIHRFEQKSDTGLKLNLLQKYIFVPLDIFKKIYKNKDTESELDAWLALLCFDEPEMIVKLLTSFPKFKAIYMDAYNLCRNTERVMEMFSEELRIMDRNTVKLMIDEMTDTINEQKKELAKNEIALKQKDKELSENEIVLRQKDKELSENEIALRQKDKELLAQKNLIQKLQKQLENK